MSQKKLELLDEGSWALMIEESNVRALHRYHGSMAGLDIDYYVSIGTERYYKGYFDRDGLSRVRTGIVAFLQDDDTYQTCVASIHDVMARLRGSREALSGLALSKQFDLYCELLCEYIAYYNSVITDTFYVDVFDLVDAELPEESRFAAKAVKDALFATDNNRLRTHEQTVDMLALARRHVAGEDLGTDLEKEIAAFVETYLSTTISSASPLGITAAEVAEHLAAQTADSVRAEESFLDNLRFRYDNAEDWSERTASLLGLSDPTRTLIRRSCELSYLKIKMREEFQELKVTVRELFLRDLIAAVGKAEFDHMLIAEISEFIRSSTRVPSAELARRRELSVFEMDGDDITFGHVVPATVVISDDRDPSRPDLVGDVLIGSGRRTYRVRKVQQHEEGLTSFDEFINAGEDTQDVVVITNVLRPHLVPKLRRFGALVTQYGGYTSHASVLCREMGINSIISVDRLLDTLETDDRVEVDFDRGTIVKVVGAGAAEPRTPDLVVDLREATARTPGEVGSKASNLMRISAVATIADGFVITPHALRHLDDEVVRGAVLEATASLGCERLVIRSSHEGEDSALGSYAGLFESHVDVDARDSARILDLVRSVHRSEGVDAIAEYGGVEGEMSVIVQELVRADVSGVVLTSTTSGGLDYLLIEYVVGDLWHLMQGDVTPLVSYVSKADLIRGRDPVRSYPAVADASLEEAFGSLATTAVELERQFSRRVEIEWGMRDGTIHVFQVRPY
jgi:phosphohistidine swiveling domain-containing protein